MTALSLHRSDVGEYADYLFIFTLHKWFLTGVVSERTVLLVMHFLTQTFSQHANNHTKIQTKIMPQIFYVNMLELILMKIPFIVKKKKKP